MTPAALPRRTLLASAALSAACFAVIGVFNPYAPLWFKSLGLGPFELGLMASLPAWTRVAAPYVWGVLADRRGERVGLIRLAAVLTACASAAYLLPLSPWTLAAVTLAMFSFNAAIVPLTETVVAQASTTAAGLDAGRYGRVRVWGSVGFLVSVLVFGAVLEERGMALFPALLLGLLVAQAAIAFALPRLPETHAADEPAPRLAPVLAEPRVRWFFAGAFFMVLSHIALYVFFSLYLDALGHSKRIVGVLWAVSVAVEIVWFWWQGRWLSPDRLHGWLVAAGLVAALRFGATAAFGGVFWVLLLAQASHAITFATQHTACVALVSRYFPGRLRSRGQALYSMGAYGLSGIVGGVLGAALSSRLGYAAVFWAAAASGLLSAFCHWRAGRCDPGP